MYDKVRSLLLQLYRTRLLALLSQLPPFPWTSRRGPKQGSSLHTSTIPPTSFTLLAVTSSG